MKRILLLTLAILVLLPCQGRGDYRYRHLTMNDGLLSNAVRNIVQDPLITVSAAMTAHRCSLTA